MMKNNLVAALLCLVLVVGLAFGACGGGSGDPIGEPDDSAVSAPATEDEQDIDASTEIQESVAPLSSSLSGELTVHVIDVGQADSILIKLPNGQAMLIDGGNSDDGATILKYLDSQDVETIDFLVVTHPHEDHIGGLPTIIEGTDIGSVYMPRASHTTRAFERLLTSIDNKGLQIDTAKAGANILDAPGLRIDIVAPAQGSYDDLNDYSAVIHLQYNDTSFLFMGDATALSEGQITADISADVIKIGHHGSNTSTSAAFLDRVAPDYAVISVGEGNTYGHPTDEVLARLDKAGVSVFRTDINGTVVFTSDGESIAVDKEPVPYKPQAPSGGGGTGSGGNSSASTAPDTSSSDDIIVYITNTGGRYHLESCRHLAKSKIEITLSEAKARGYTPCGTCKPPY